MLYFTRLKRFLSDKHSSLLGPFKSSEEKEVLWIWSLAAGPSLGQPAEGAAAAADDAHDDNEDGDTDDNADQLSEAETAGVKHSDQSDRFVSTTFDVKRWNWTVHSFLEAVFLVRCDPSMNELWAT